MRKLLLGLVLLLGACETKEEHRRFREDTLLESMAYIYDVRTELCFVRQSWAGTLTLIPCTDQVKAVADLKLGVR